MLVGKRKRNTTQEVNSSSMADIAFLLLVFFLVATQVKKPEEGIFTILPKKSTETNPPVKIDPNNLLEIAINSENKILIEKTDYAELGEIKSIVSKFLTNNGKDPESSDNPKEAVVSLRVDRGTNYEYYLSTVDQVRGAYHELHAKFLGITLKEYLELDKTDAVGSRMIRNAKKEYPIRFSIAEPTHFENY